MIATGLLQEKNNWESCSFSKLRNPYLLINTMTICGHTHIHSNTEFHWIVFRKTKFSSEVNTPVMYYVCEVQALQIFSYCLHRCTLRNIGCRFIMVRWHGFAGALSLIRLYPIFLSVPGSTIDYVNLLWNSGINCIAICTVKLSDCHRHFTFASSAIIDCFAYPSPLTTLMTSLPRYDASTG